MGLCAFMACHFICVGVVFSLSLYIHSKRETYISGEEGAPLIFGWRIFNIREKFLFFGGVPHGHGGGNNWCAAAAAAGAWFLEEERENASLYI